MYPDAILVPLAGRSVVHCLSSECLFLERLSIGECNSNNVFFYHSVSFRKTVALKYYLVLFKTIISIYVSFYLMNENIFKTLCHSERLKDASPSQNSLKSKKFNLNPKFGQLDDYKIIYFWGLYIHEILLPMNFSITWVLLRHYKNESTLPYKQLLTLNIETGVFF